MALSDDDILVNELGKLAKSYGHMGASSGARFAAKHLPTETCQKEILIKSNLSSTLTTILKVAKESGGILQDNDSRYPCLSITIGSGFLNMNPAIVHMEVISCTKNTCNVLITTAAKEGLIKQNTAQKAMNKIIPLFDKYKLALTEEAKEHSNLTLYNGHNKDVTEKAGSLNRKQSNFAYDIAISYASENREVITKIVEKLRENNIHIFYDEYEKTKLWGKNLSTYFQQVYGEKSCFVLVFVSKEYSVKDWTNFEFTIAHDAAKTKKTEFILPVRLDDTPLVGLPRNIAYLDLNKEGIEGIFSAIRDKLNDLQRF